MKKRPLIYFVGLLTTPLVGISLIVHVEIGAGPWDAVAVGLKMHLGLTVGMWSIIAQGMVAVITAVIERVRFQFESVFCDNTQNLVS